MPRTFTINLPDAEAADMVLAARQALGPAAAPLADAAVVVAFFRQALRGPYVSLKAGRAVEPARQSRGVAQAQLEAELQATRSTERQAEAEAIAAAAQALQGVS